MISTKHGKNDYFDMYYARINDQTVIEGGYIKTSLIDTDALVVKKAAGIGNFYISENNLISNGYLSNKGVCIRPDGSFEAKARYNEQTTVAGSGLSVIIGGSGTPISCITDIHANQALSFSVTFDHIDGDPDWHSYVQLKVKPLPHKNHIAAKPGNHAFRSVVIDEYTGLFGYE